MAAFMKLGDIKGQFQADELTGTFNALNETTNVRPSKGESISIVHPAFKTGYDPGPVGSADGIDRSSVFWEVTYGSYRADDDLNDGLTGEGRPMNVWTNGSATSFEDRTVGDYDANDVGIQAGCGQGVPIGSRFPGIDRSIKGIQVVYFEDIGSGDQDTNDAVFDMRQNLGTNSGPGGTTFMTETFEPAAGMNSFGESLNPVLEIGANSGPGGTSYMKGQIDMLSDSISPGDGSRCLM